MLYDRKRRSWISVSAFSNTAGRLKKVAEISTLGRTPVATLSTVQSLVPLKDELFAPGFGTRLRGDRCSVTQHSDMDLRGFDRRVTL
jgi:hypothetical protein